MYLPEKYCEKMRELLGSDFEKYEEAMLQKPYNGIRINNKKIPAGEMADLLKKDFFRKDLKTRPVHWISNGFYIKDVSPASGHPYYKAGLYYIQDPSAMTPAENLPVDPDDRVLDMCAAPGGKATQLASELSGKGFLHANDISSSRCRALVRNLELAGIDNACVTAEEPEGLAVYYTEYFDKILIDAPCSGEGMFRKDPAMIGSWLERQPGDYTALQYSLLKAGAAMLKKGGMLLYSTCTFAQEENEDNIIRFLEEHRDFELIALRRFEGFSRGLKGIGDAIRLYPHKVGGEGQFLCLMRRKGITEEVHSISSGTVPGAAGNKKERKRTPLSGLPEEVRSFLGQLSYDFSDGSFLVGRDRIFFLKRNIPYIPQLRYIRTGLYIGRYARNRFEPSQALALALRADQFPYIIDLPSDSSFINKYLKGESFDAGDPALINHSYADGLKWRLVCADGYPLGWARISGSMLKNNYDPSLRLM